MIEAISPIKYLLEANFCIVIFYLLYHYILKKDTFFQFNRAYLIVVPIIALALPLINFGSISTIENNTPTALNFIPKSIETFQQSEVLFQERIYTQETGFSISLGELFFWFYIIIGSFFILKLLASIGKIALLISKNDIQQQDGYKTVIIKSKIPAFSFFNYLFWNGKEDENTSFIFEHEKIHIRQKHSIDVIMMEIIVAILWINPFIYLFRKQLQTIHEYIADQHVLNLSGEREKYASLLFNLFTSAKPNQVVTSFNSQIKNRLAMMYQKKSAKINLLKIISIAPILMLLLALFSFDLANTDSIVSGIETTSETSILSIENSQKTINKKYDRPYVLKFGAIEFELTEQVGDGKKVNPPLFSFTYKTAEKLSTLSPILLNRNNGKKYSYNLDVRIGEESDPLSKFDLNALLANVDKTKESHIYVKNLKPNGEDLVLNLRIALFPESSFQMDWGDRKFTTGDKIKMTGTEFATKALSNHLLSRNAIYKNADTYFEEIEKISINGSPQNFEWQSFPLLQTNSLELAIKSSKKGDRFIFKGIQVESYNVPSNYSFEVEITESVNPNNLKLSNDLNKPRVVNYIINGNKSDQAIFDQLSPSDILELKILDKFGRPTKDKNVDQVIIVTTKKDAITPPAKITYLLNGKTTSKESIERLDKNNILEYKIYNRFGEVIDKVDGQCIIMVKTKKK